MCSITSRKYFTKLAGTITILCFLTTNVSYPVSDPSSTISFGPAVGSGEVSRIEASHLPLDQFALPPELGRVEEALSGGGPDVNKRVLIHLRDAHGSYEAQIHLKKIIEFLTREYGIRTILVEGAAGRLRPELLALFDNEELNLKIADELAQAGELSGTELFLLSHRSDSSIAAFGVEDLHAYARNLSEFKKVHARKGFSDQFILKVRSQIETKGSQTLNKPLREFLKSWHGWREGRLDLIGFLWVVRKFARQALEIDLAHAKAQTEYPMLVRFFKAKDLESGLQLDRAIEEKAKLIQFLNQSESGQKFLDFVSPWDLEKGLGGWLSDKLPRIFAEELYSDMAAEGFKFGDYPELSKFLAFVIFQSELEGQKLFDELERLNESIFSALAVSQKEKNLISLIDNSILLEKLLHLELTRAETVKVSGDSAQLHPIALVKRLAAQGARPKISKQVGYKVGKTYELAARFYRDAKKREMFIVANSERILAERGETKAILVTGGYHSEGLKESFRAKTYSYLEVSPRITSLENIEKNYLQTMLGSRRTIFDLAQISQLLRMTGEEAAKVLPSEYERINRQILDVALRNASGVLKIDDLIRQLNRTALAERSGLSFQFGSDRNGDLYLLLIEGAIGEPGEIRVAIRINKDALDFHRAMGENLKKMDEPARSIPFAPQLMKFRSLVGATSGNSQLFKKQPEPVSQLKALGIKPVHVAEVSGRSELRALQVISIEAGQEPQMEALSEIARILNLEYADRSGSRFGELIRQTEKVNQDLGPFYLSLHSLLTALGGEKSRVLGLIDEILIRVNQTVSSHRLTFEEANLTTPFSWVSVRAAETGAFAEVVSAEQELRQVSELVDMGQRSELRTTIFDVMVSLGNLIPEYPILSAASGAFVLVSFMLGGWNFFYDLFSQKPTAKERIKQLTLDFSLMAPGLYFARALPPMMFYFLGMFFATTVISTPFLKDLFSKRLNNSRRISSFLFGLSAPTCIVFWMSWLTPDSKAEPRFEPAVGSTVSGEIVDQASRDIPALPVPFGEERVVEENSSIAAVLSRAVPMGGMERAERAKAAEPQGVRAEKLSRVPTVKEIITRALETERLKKGVPRQEWIANRSRLLAELIDRYYPKLSQQQKDTLHNFVLYAEELETPQGQEIQRGRSGQPVFLGIASFQIEAPSTLIPDLGRRIQKMEGMTPAMRRDFLKEMGLSESAAALYGPSDFGRLLAAYMVSDDEKFDTRMSLLLVESKAILKKLSGPLDSGSFKKTYEEVYRARKNKKTGRFDRLEIKRHRAALNMISPYLKRSELREIEPLREKPLVPAVEPIEGAARDREAGRRKPWEEFLPDFGPAAIVEMGEEISESEASRLSEMRVESSLAEMDADSVVFRLILVESGIRPEEQAGIYVSNRTDISILKDLPDHGLDWILATNLSNQAWDELGLQSYRLLTPTGKFLYAASDASNLNKVVRNAAKRGLVLTGDIQSENGISYFVAERIKVPQGFRRFGKPLSLAGSSGIAFALVMEDERGDRFVLKYDGVPIRWGRDFQNHKTRREHEVLRRLQPEGLLRPDIVKSRGVVEANGIAGLKLERLVSSDQTMPILDFAYGLVQTLAYIHSKGIVHRDLKPDNVFVVDGPEGSPIPLVYDFDQASEFNVSSGQAQRTSAGNPSFDIMYMNLFERFGLIHWGALKEAVNRGEIPALTDAEGRLSREKLRLPVIDLVGWAMTIQMLMGWIQDGEGSELHGKVDKTLPPELHSALREITVDVLKGKYGNAKAVLQALDQKNLKGAGRSELRAAEPDPQSALKSWTEGRLKGILLLSENGKVSDDQMRELIAGARAIFLFPFPAEIKRQSGRELASGIIHSVRARLESTSLGSEHLKLMRRWLIYAKRHTKEADLISELQVLATGISLRIRSLKRKQKEIGSDEKALRSEIRINEPELTGKGLGRNISAAELVAEQISSFVTDLPNLTEPLLAKAVLAEPPAVDEKFVYTEVAPFAELTFAVQFDRVVSQAVKNVLPEVVLDGNSRLAGTLRALLVSRNFVEKMNRSAKIWVSDPTGAFRSALRQIIDGYQDPIEKAIVGNAISNSIRVSGQPMATLSRQHWTAATFVETEGQLAALGDLGDIFVAFADWADVKDRHAIAEMLLPVFMGAGRLAQVMRGKDLEEQKTLVGKLQELGFMLDLAKGRNVVTILLDRIEAIYQEVKAERAISIAA